MIELRDHVLHLLLLLGCVLLHHLQVLLISSLLISQLLFVVLHRGVVSLLCTFTFLLKASFEPVSLDLKERLELSELLLRLLLHLTERVLELRRLLLQLPLQLSVSLLGTILTFLEHAGFLGLEKSDLFEGFGLDLLRRRQLLSQSLSFSYGVLHLSLESEFHFGVTLL